MPRTFAWPQCRSSVASTLGSARSANATMPCGKPREPGASAIACSQAVSATGSRRSISACRCTDFTSSNPAASAKKSSSR